MSGVEYAFRVACLQMGVLLNRGDKCLENLVWYEKIFF